MTTMETEATSAERATLARDYESLGERLARRGIAIDRIKEQAAAFGVAVPSWGAGTGGTRFARFHKRVKLSFGWGTLLTNDFRNLAPDDALGPYSLVCKAVSANGRPTVKLSDNPAKALGPADQVARYKRVFDVGAQKVEPVLV